MTKTFQAELNSIDHNDHGSQAFPDDWDQNDQDDWPVDPEDWDNHDSWPSYINPEYPLNEGIWDDWESDLDPNYPFGDNGGVWDDWGSDIDLTDPTGGALDFSGSGIDLTDSWDIWAHDSSFGSFHRSRRASGEHLKRQRRMPHRSNYYGNYYNYYGNYYYRYDNFNYGLYEYHNLDEIRELIENNEQLLNHIAETFAAFNQNGAGTPQGPAREIFMGVEYQYGLRHHKITIC